MNKSLNHGFRKKQLQDIQIQNAKLLKRLQQKKSDYQADKMKQEWKKQKNVIKNLVNYPFIIRDKLPKRRKSMTSHANNYTTNNTFYNINNNPNAPAYNSSLKQPINLVKIKSINNNKFIINIKYEQNYLSIVGENKNTKETKIIEIPKQQALQFIHFQCNNKIQNLFNHLQYDNNKKVLYLIGKDVEIGDGNIINFNNNNENIQENEEEQYDENNDRNDQNDQTNKHFISEKKMSKIYEQQQINTQKQSQIIFKNNHHIFMSNNQNYKNNNNINPQQNNIDNQSSQPQPSPTLTHLQHQLQKSIQQANNQHHLDTIHNQQNQDEKNIMNELLDDDGNDEGNNNLK